MSIDDDGPFNDRGFHRGPPDNPPHPLCL
jgi:hypothetical protein